MSVAGYGAVRRGRLAVRREVVPASLLAALFFLANGGLFRLGEANGLAWLVLSGAVGLVALGDPRGAARACVRHRVVFLLPGFLLLTAVWSVAPVVTLAAGLKMIVTVALCCVLGARLTSRAVLTALALSMGLAMALSLVNLVLGVFPPVYETNGAFLGIFPQKTQVARTAVWLAFALVALAAARGGRGLLATGVAVALFPVTLIAHSVTGALGFGFVAVLVAALFLVRLPASLRLVLPLLVLGGGAALVAVYWATGGAPVEAALAVAGKGETLTGRTVLWSLGLAIWSESPVVGIGYGAFWDGAAFAADRALVEAQVDEGLNGFHNAAVELLVASGFVGLGVWLIGVGWALWRLVRRALGRRSVDAAVWAVALAALMGMALFETSLFAARSLNLMLMTFALMQARSGRGG